MSELSVKVKHQETKEEIVKSYDFPDTVEELKERFDDDVIISNFTVGAKKQMRDKLYSLTHGENPKSVEESLAEMENWQPSVQGSRTAKDPKASLIAAFAKMTDEERAALIAQLQGVAIGDTDEDVDE